MWINRATMRKVMSKRRERDALIWLAPWVLAPWVLAAGLVFCICVCAAGGDLPVASAGIEIPEAVAGPEDTAGVITVRLSAPHETAQRAVDANNPDVVQRACELMRRGDFDQAGRLIADYSGEDEDEGRLVSRLGMLVAQYEKIKQSRQAQRQKQYGERLAKLDKLASGEPAGDGNDINDVNERERVSAVLSAVAQAWSLADKQQKDELLNKPFVKEAVAGARAEAARLEGRGKWLEAYLTCWSWLAAIDPNNKQYTEHAEQLAAKADIAVAFEDSPCETAKERFENVKKRMFVRAVDTLNFNYVSKIDYHEMALKAVNRCKSLAEVVRTLISLSSGEPPGGEPNEMILSRSFENFSWPDQSQMSALLAGLSSLQDELKEIKSGLSKDGFISVFERVLELNSTTAALPEQILVVQFAAGSLKTLDPYTVMVWPRQVKDFEKLMTNEFTGIGIEIVRQKGRLTVASLLPDTPAYNSGLDAQDVIEKVDGKPTKDMSLSCAVRHITGPAGTKVKLTIRRPGEAQTSDIVITRAKIVVPTIRGWQRTEHGTWLYMIDAAQRIGYVRLTEFSDKTASDLEKVLTMLEVRQMRGLILDLRFNTGGFLESAIEVADRFLSQGLIVMTRPRFGMPTYAVANRKGTHPDYPMAVLINGGSASASEIVAGALGDKSHRRAVLVGERTYGKGLVQGITHYPGGGAQLKYTMANYYLPSGRKVKSREQAKKEHTKDWGVGPNVEVKLRSDEIRKMLDAQRDNDVLVKAGHDNSAAEVNKHSIEDTIEADPQLSIGILLLKSELIAEEARELKRKAA